MMDKPQLISLSEVAAVLNDTFNLTDDDTISRNTPHMWWYRTRQEQNIALPMPGPVIETAVHEIWDREEVVGWFAEWKGLSR